MGYDVHITRAAYWYESEASPITLTEWRNYIESDIELAIDLLNSRDDKLDVNWYGEGGRPDGSEGVWSFWWTDGRITAKNPDKATIGKITRIAIVLNARLVGDEDEEYRPNGEIYEEQFTEKPPGIFKRLSAWWSNQPLPERKTSWVLTGRWDK